MKKIKADKSTNPISLSAKKAGPLKHQMLFTPYKIQWKNVQPIATSQPSSRTFFNTMKNELSNLKSDVQRLIKKEGNKLCNKNINSSPFQENIAIYNRESIKKCDYQEPIQIQKKTQNEYCQKNQPNNELLTEVLFLPNQNEQQQNQNSKFIQKLVKQLKEKQQQAEALSKQNKLQKNLIQQLKKENYTLYNDLQVKIASQNKILKKSEVNIQKNMQQIDQLVEKNIALEASVANLELVNKKIQNHNLEQRKELQFQLQQQLQKLGQFKIAHEELKTHNMFLQQTIQNLSAKIENMSGKYKEKQFYIRQLQVKLQALRTSQRYRETENQEQIAELKCVWQKQHQRKLCQIQAKYTIKIKQLQAQSHQSHQKAIKIQNQYKIVNADLQKQINEKQKQLTKIKLQIQKLQEVERSKPANNQEIDFKRLGAEYERKLNQLVETNYELKNKITNLQSQMQKLEVEKQKLDEEIKIYEEYNQKKNSEEGIKQQWQKIVNEMSTLKNQKQTLVQQFELKIMKLEIELQIRKQNKKSSEQLKPTNVQDINAALKDQIALNIVLKQKMRQKQQQLNISREKKNESEEKLKILSEKLLIEQKKNSLIQISERSQKEITDLKINERLSGFIQQLQLLKRKYNNMELCLANKNKQLCAKNDFIEKVLIAKIGKKEQQDQIGYLIQKMKLFCSS